MATESVGVLLATIDGSIVNVALPTLVDELGTTFSIIQWVPLGYLVTLASLNLGIGRLGDIVGKRRIYTLGFSAFTAASVACAFAPTVHTLIAFRVVQADGAAMILALGISILTDAFPATERGRALGLIGTAVVNLPIGVIGTMMAIRRVPVSRSTCPGR